MTQPVYNLNSPIVEVKNIGGRLVGYLLQPWNSFFQQLVQAPPAAIAISLASGEKFTPNSNGSLIITGGVISNISLVRGSTVIDLTGQKIIPVSIADTISITYSAAPDIQFLGA